MASGDSLLDLGLRSLERVTRAVPVAGEASQLLDLFRTFGEPLGERSLSDPAHDSQIFFNRCPYDISIAIGEQTSVRFEIETQTLKPSLQDYNRAAESAIQVAAERFGLDLSLFEKVREILGREWSIHPSGRISPAGDPYGKLYIMRHYRFEHVFERWRDVFALLGRGEAIPPLERLLATGFEIGVIAIDILPQGQRPSLEVYVATAPPRVIDRAELERLGEAGVGYVKGDASKFVASLLGPAPWWGGVHCPVLVSYVVDSDSLLSPTFFVPFPIQEEQRLIDDQVIYDRVRRTLDAFGLSDEPYRAAVEALAERPLAETSSFHYFVGLRHHKGKPLIATYFTPPVFGENIGNSLPVEA